MREPHPSLPSVIFSFTWDNLRASKTSSSAVIIDEYSVSLSKFSQRRSKIIQPKEFWTVSSEQNNEAF